mmetsp:Transcript_19336/g.29451  ORF Transcript_19336/g.29451 Transcript_19336/m.29451 type:complete len:228 (+) Transcript_19336:729-1412(+)
MIFLFHTGTKKWNARAGLLEKACGRRVSAFCFPYEYVLICFSKSLKIVNPANAFAFSIFNIVSTISVRLGGSSWGNIRSTVDGVSLQSSTGKPIFYLPLPDPTNIDVLQNQNISLQFSEASLAERLDDKGNSCGGMDAMDPLCARVMISGIAKKVTCPEHLKLGQKAFKERHPLAPWLWKGGAHTGGDYYTIEPQKIMLLDYYGGPTLVDVQKYLDWKVPELSLVEE